MTQGPAMRKSLPPPIRTGPISNSALTQSFNHKEPKPLEHNGNMKRKEASIEVTRFLDAWFAVRQFIQAANFNRFQGAGLSATQFMTLNLLPFRGAGIAIGELARRMNLRPATVAKTVDSLETRKFVARMRDKHDKRFVLIKVTNAGQELQNAASAGFHAQIANLFKAMQPSERYGLIAGLESLANAAVRQNEPAAGRLNRAPDVVLPGKRSARRSLRV